MIKKPQFTQTMNINNKEVKGGIINIRHLGRECPGMGLAKFFGTNTFFNRCLGEAIFMPFNSSTSSF